jgi:hypothetical protein
MATLDDIHALLKQVKATKLRRGKHDIYKLPDGGNYTIAVTPSDYRGVNNQYSSLKKRLRPFLPEQIKKAVSARSRTKSPTPHKVDHLKDLTPVHIKSFGRKLLEAGYEAPPPAEHKSEKPKLHIERKKPQHGPVHHLPLPLVVQASEILNTKGPEAYREFINQHHNDFTTQPEVSPVIKQQEEQKMEASRIELMAEATRQELKKLEESVQRNRMQIETIQRDTKQKIENLELDSVTKSESMDKLKTFLSTFETLMQVGSSIEPLIELRLHTPTPSTHVKNKSMLGSTQIIDRAMPLFEKAGEGPTGVNAQDIYEYFQRDPALRPVSKYFIHNALSYEQKRKECRIVRLRQGEYILKSNVHEAPVNGHQAALQASA